jgi:hypothetical protein
VRAQIDAAIETDRQAAIVLDRLLAHVRAAF